MVTCLFHRPCLLTVELILYAKNGRMNEISGKIQQICLFQLSRVISYLKGSFVTVCEFTRFDGGPYWSTPTSFGTGM